jgi:CheY-like chemotaxis protein
MTAQIVVDAPSRQVVLIVEDEALVRVTAVDMIEEAGFEVLEAANADEAILLLEARRDITVVFTDIEMCHLSRANLGTHSVRHLCKALLVTRSSVRLEG